MTNLWILAQAGEPAEQSEVSSQPVGGGEQAVTIVDSNAPPRGAAQRQQSPYSWLIFIVAVMAMMYFILFREPQKRQKQQQKLVKSLKKNDKVRTIGGIIGTVVDIRDDEIVLKVDESNNTKIRIMPSAIGKNLTSDEK